MKNVFSLISVIIIFVLSSNGSNSEKKKPYYINKSPTIEVFTDLPSEIDGCTCVFSLDSINLVKNKYIYVNDFAEMAYMKIDGKMNKFTLSTKSNFGEKSIHAIYSNDSYEVVVDIKDERAGGYESTIEIGIITVKNKADQKTATAFYGICGC